MEDYSDADNIGTRARTAAAWQFLSRGINTALQMVTSIVLARLLMPADFGVVAMAAMVTGLAGVFRDLGLGQALVQRPDISKEHTRSAFWGTLVMALLLYVAMYVSAPHVGTYFSEPRMILVLRISALTFVLSPFAVLPRSLLQRDLDFKTPFFAEVTSSLAYGGVGITMALTDYGYWALVGAGLAGEFVRTVVLCILTRYIPPFVPTFHGIKDLYEFGVGITGIGLIGFAGKYADRLVIGRYLDASAFGIYDRAFMLNHKPLQLTISPLNPIIFSALARMQEVPERFRRAYYRLLSALCSISFLLTALLIANAPEAIPVVFGEHWREAVVPVQLLGAFAITASIGGLATSARKAAGKLGLETVIQIMRLVLVPAGALAGSPWGIVGTTAGVALAYILLTFAHIWFSNVVIGTSTGGYLRALFGPTILGLSCYLASTGVRMLAASLDWSAPVTLVAAVAAGGAVAILILAKAPWRGMHNTRQELMHLFQLARRRLRRKAQ